MDCDLSLLVSWHCTIVINDNYWRLPPLLLCSLLIPLTLEMISIRLSVAIENRIHVKNPLSGNINTRLRMYQVLLFKFGCHLCKGSMKSQNCVYRKLTYKSLKGNEFLTDVNLPERAVNMTRK